LRKLGKYQAEERRIVEESRKMVQRSEKQGLKRGKKCHVKAGQVEIMKIRGKEKRQISEKGVGGRVRAGESKRGGKRIETK